MFGNKKKEPNYAEEVEILLGEDARYESGKEGSTEEICPLLSVYGDYAVCSHLVSASYARNSYDYIYEIRVYPSERDRTAPAFHGSILKIHNIRTYQKIFCCTEKAGSLSELKGSGWAEQEKVGKLRVWTEGGRLYQEDVKMIEWYQEGVKKRLCMDFDPDEKFFQGKAAGEILEGRTGWDGAVLFQGETLRELSFNNHHT